MQTQSQHPEMNMQPTLPLTYFMYSARSVARMACFIIFSVALYSSMERLLRIWFPFTKKQNVCLSVKWATAHQFA